MKVPAEAGKPSRINKVWFRARYGQTFPDLLPEETDEFLDACIEDVYTLFYGIPDLWSHLERAAYEEKTRLCYGLLVAWYITDLYPTYAVGVMSMGGGLPVKAKKIGGTTIQFSDRVNKFGSSNNADLLSSLKSNTFGVKAYFMIKASGKINLFLSV